MSRQRWQRISALFETVVDLEPEERERCLVEADAEEPGLRQAVESLLESDRRAEDYLNEPALPRTDPAPTASPGSRLGSYRVVERLGEGGMSTVYLATRDDQAFRRHVAIKLIRRGMESRTAQRRLRTERQILANLDHPHIAKLHDGGTTQDGQPYFVMEYVSGEPIDTWCEVRRLGLEERLVLFRKVCAAVHYAHQNLVVHRDIKPSNILVTREGEPRLLDFGIAKLLDPGLHDPVYEPTATWQRALTPHYASPEQVRGETITTASDIYSLGVLLYRLLSGRLPFRFEHQSPHEIARTLTESDPPAPSVRVLQAKTEAEMRSPSVGLEVVASLTPKELARKLTGDLDEIALMALRNDVNQRYGSAEQLAADLERHTEGLPVLARRQSLRYRLEKLGRRHWRSLTAAVIFLVLLLLFAVSMALLSVRLTRERDDKIAALAVSEHEGRKNAAILAFVTDLFESADPGISQGEQITMRQALEHGEAALERQLEDQPAVQAALYATLGRLYLRLGSAQQAEEQLQSALEIYRQLGGDTRLEMAEVESELAMAALEGQGDRRSEARDLALGALARAEAVVEAEDQRLIPLLDNVVTAHCYLEEWSAADEPSSRGLSLARQHGAPLALLTEAVNNRAVVLRNLGLLAEAEAHYREGLELQRRWVGEVHPTVAVVLNNLGKILELRGQLSESEAHHREALALRQRLYGDASVQTVQSLYQVSVLRALQDDLAGAEIFAHRAYVIYRRHRGDRSPRTQRLAAHLAALGDRQRANEASSSER
ncbi:MAG: serine/threonine-protein kinase [Acidobacteriota bacterium]